jgi:hypothetical protein
MLQGIPKAGCDSEPLVVDEYVAFRAFVAPYIRDRVIGPPERGKRHDIQMAVDWSARGARQELKDSDVLSCQEQGVTMLCRSEEAMVALRIATSLRVFRAWVAVDP